ncbi:hypothetical protein VTO42DRAFT_4853 [Malbranchea cinnamomea]
MSHARRFCVSDPILENYLLIDQILPQPIQGFILFTGITTSFGNSLFQLPLKLAFITQQVCLDDWISHAYLSTAWDEHRGRPMSESDTIVLFSLTFMTYLVIAISCSASADL